MTVDYEMKGEAFVKLSTGVKLTIRRWDTFAQLQLQMNGIGHMDISLIMTQDDARLIVGVMNEQFPPSRELRYTREEMREACRNNYNSALETACDVITYEVADAIRARKQVPEPVDDGSRADEPMVEF